REARRVPEEDPEVTPLCGARPSRPLLKTAAGTAALHGENPRMIDRVITFSVRRPWLVVLAAAMLAVWGGITARGTPVAAIPDLSENQVIVFTEWPGHGPQEIEDQIGYPLTLELKGLDGVRVVRSSSDVGFSMVSVIFEDRVGWDAARRQVEDVLSRTSTLW